MRTGDLVTSVGTIEVDDARPPQVLVAALGTQMLKVTGRLADGTITWSAGPRTCRDHIVPTISEAAADAGRAAPSRRGALPVVITDDVDRRVEGGGHALEIYGQLPSYRAMLDQRRRRRIRRHRDHRRRVAGIRGARAARGAGVTDFTAAEMGRTPEEVDRTHGAFLRSQL